MNKIAFGALLSILLLLPACAPSEEEITSRVSEAVQKTSEALEPPEPIVIRETVEIPIEVIAEVTVEVTRFIEVPVTVTFTPGPSPTSTITPTPTNTPTLTPTPTPFNVYGCTNLRSVSNFWNIKGDDVETKLYPEYDKLDGVCVKFYGSEDIGIVATDYGWLGLHKSLDFTFVIDDFSPEGVRSVPTYSTIWGIWEVKRSGEYNIHLRRVEPFTDLQQPIEDDGFYMVGQDWDISPGQWKSLWPPGTVDNCYWARTNPDTGDIKDNHFGQAGVFVRMYEGDLFESDDCAPWVFISP